MGTAWVFPGQGSQKQGMTTGVLQDELAQDRFAQASALLGRDLLAICNGTAVGPDHDLNDTRNSQPALFVLESVLLDRCKQQGHQADVLAGHSLGELVALYGAGCFDFRTGLTLVKQRSELMAAAGGGAMVAVMGFVRADLETAVAAQQDVVIANDNSASQVVLSGTTAAVRHICSILDCKRSVPLAVSGAFHSPLMKEPAARFARILETIPFTDANVPVVSNATACSSLDGSTLKANLVQQMVSGVRWRETMDRMASSGIDTVLEIGPGAVLSGLLKRSLPNLHIRRINTMADLTR
ncbi:ACP S-malonyltransferase [Candidatus Synechococcus spongiarum]|uniref:Malonyl CoA-acyl carrier protein transacylase n=1 Tax=Candidatus Synechococcus spongiarum LMB bulk15N TaxID=1943583 RepID=A0A1T1D7Q0_9SYNE|nr:ACP S-malonyltransferase [Candidatus Synechococcus spongiarum]OOV36593.1 [acyl-carrier-protein] S-malonyltransferase [Candidatus Synechococcus spongiarum LMB bulk15N]